MAGVRDDVVGGTGDAPGQHGGHLAEAGHVPLSHGDEGRYGDALEHVDGPPGLAVRILAQPVLAGVARHHGRQRGGQVGPLARGGEQRVGQPGFAARPHPALLDPPGDLVQGPGRLGVPGHAVEHRVQQGQAADPVRGGQRGLQRHPAAERQAGQHRVADVQVVQERDEVAGVGVRDAGVERPGGAEPAAVVAHHPEPGRQRPDLRIPHAHVQAEAVDEDDGGPVPGHLVHQPRAGAFQDGGDAAR